MAKQTINVGSAPNDNNGSTLRQGGIIINENFTEIYTQMGNGTSLLVSTTGATDDQVLKWNGTSFVAADYNKLTSALDTSGNSIISTYDTANSQNRNISLVPHTGANVVITNDTATYTFGNLAAGSVFNTTVQYKNEYTSISAAPAAANWPGYFYTVDGDDNPYVNVSITTGGVGDVRAKLLTEYSSIDLLGDVDTTSQAPTADQVLKWNAVTSKWVPGDDASGAGGGNGFGTIATDTGSVIASAPASTVNVLGGTNIATEVTDGNIVVNLDTTLVTTFAGLTDTNVSGLTQGDSLFWNGTEWVPTRTPIIWWELNANGNADYTFTGPGFIGTANDPTLYVYRGFTYAFDNSVQGGGHPFRIQSTQGLSGTPYTAGQSGSGSSVLYWTVPLNAPATLYYQCTLHAAMQGQINVVS